jgi:hypothetical protein
MERTAKQVPAFGEVHPPKARYETPEQPEKVPKYQINPILVT